MLTVAIFLALALGLQPFSAAQPTTEDIVETGRLLVLLLDAGRVTIANKQPLLNDPKKGNKGYTPAVFEQELAENFRQRTGLDLFTLQQSAVPELAKELLPSLVVASKKAVGDVQHIINLEGIGFKGFIPATFGTIVASTFRSYTQVYLRQTMDPPRNPRNSPDDFERRVLTRLANPASPRQKDGIVSEVVDGGKAVRVLLPLYYQKACLACHGEPKGERDITGYPKEGAKEGDFGGAISVKLEIP
ncbi:Tll0287-like domain-containing protein [Candidatus Nitrospira bockiana]